MREADFDPGGEAGGEAAIRRALVDMMLQSTWDSIQDKDFEYSFEYSIAVLSLEKNQAAAFALGAAALAFLAEAMPWAGLEPLLADYLRHAEQIKSLPFEELDGLVENQERLRLLAFARTLATSNGAVLPGLEDCAAAIVQRIDAIRQRARIDEPSEKGISGIAVRSVRAPVTYSNFRSGSHMGESDLHDIFISHLSAHGSFRSEFYLEGLALESALTDIAGRKNPALRAWHLSRAQIRLLLLRARLRAARSSRTLILSYRRMRRR